MILNDSTHLIIINNYTRLVGPYSVRDITDIANVYGLIKLAIADPIKLGNVFTTFILREKTSKFKPPGDAIGTICVYLAACCFIGQTAGCKSLITNIADTYQISVDTYMNQVNTKEVLKELVKIILDKYNDLFIKVAEELHLN